MHPSLSLHPEVKQALVDHQPVVALESTIISHGLPFPENLATAQELAQTVRDNGAVPATIGILDGKIKIGLDEEALLRLADPASHVIKVSRRDIAHVVAEKIHGATTVASTMIFAQMAGIAVFATGGIGGVHKGAHADFDISADLPELARTNVCVVSAGPKAILDLPLTMEYLESWGVPVIGYGTDELPAFWSRESGIMLSERADSPEQIAARMAVKWSLNLKGGLLVANPVPHQNAIAHDQIAGVIDNALASAKDKAITGKALTPYLLDKIRQDTKGASLVTNQALVKNNAALGAQIACAYAAKTL